MFKVRLNDGPEAGPERAEGRESIFPLDDAPLEARRGGLVTPSRSSGVTPVFLASRESMPASASHSRTWCTAMHRRRCAQRDAYPSWTWQLERDGIFGFCCQLSNTN